MVGDAESITSGSAKDVGRKSHPYSYHSPHDTSEYARSLEKFHVMNGSSSPALVLAMTIGIAEFDHVLKSPPFSNLTTKTMQEGYIPINSDLGKEILRRSHFLLQEIDKTKSDHPLRDNSMRLRMPQPSQWTREKRVKFLEEKNMLELSPLDLDFLRVKVGEIRDEIERKLSSGKESGKRLIGKEQGGLTRALASPASTLGTATKRDGAEIANHQGAHDPKVTAAEGGRIFWICGSKACSSVWSVRCPSSDP
jgi:hypothetical protein